MSQHLIQETRIGEFNRIIGGGWTHQPSPEGTDKGYYYCHFTPAVRDCIASRLGQKGFGHSLTPNPETSENLVLSLTEEQAGKICIANPKLHGTGSLIAQIIDWKSSDKPSTQAARG